MTEPDKSELNEITEGKVEPTALKLSDSNESEPTEETENKTDEPTTRTLAKVLEDLSIGIMEASNADTLDPIIAERTMASLIFNTDIYRKEYTQFKIDPREHVAKIWEFANLAPDFRVDAYNASSDIDEVKGLGTVLVTSRLSGYFDDLACERVSQFKWRRRRGVWRAVELHLLSGGAFTVP
jgi:hypothetical protein